MLFSDEHNMDAIREIKQEPYLEGYQFPYAVFQDEINCETRYKDINLSSASGIDIKEEPCSLGRSLIKLEEPQVPHINLQNEANFEMDYNNDNVMLNGYKVATGTQIKEEHFYEGRTSENVKCWTILSLDSDPLSWNGTKDTTSCITGIDDYPKAESLRLHADTPCSDRHETSAFSNNAQNLQMKEVSVEFKRHDVNEVFFHENICSQRSTQQSNTVMQDNTKPYKCSVCGKNFRYTYYLKRHMLIHSGIKPYACDICEKKFTQMAHLKNHHLLHSGTKPHKCDFCDMSFTQLGNLKKHISTHSGSKPYKCDMCEKGFIARSVLSRHMLTHSGVKAYKCDICEKRFKDPSVLTRHKLIHSISHKCDVCEKSFTRRSALSKHKFALSHA